MTEEVQIKEKDFVEEMSDEIKGKVVADKVYTPFKEQQFKMILQKTPQKHIQQRKGKGGGSFDYVSGVYVQKMLNYIFGFNWNFEIKKYETLENQVIVFGKLIVKTWDEKKEDYIEISKEQFGRADIKYYSKGDKQGKVMDIGNDLKAAGTDCLKKCASQLGIAGDVYGKAEFVDVITNIESEKKKKEGHLELLKKHLSITDKKDLEKEWETIEDKDKALLKDFLEELKKK